MFGGFELKDRELLPEAREAVARVAVPTKTTADVPGNGWLLPHLDP